MAGRPRLVLVHGIGEVRDAESWSGGTWVAALAAGGTPPADVVFVDYSGLFHQHEVQGEVAEYEADSVLALVRELVDELAAEPSGPMATRVLTDARVQLSAAEAQGPSSRQRVATLGNVLTTLLQLPGLRQACQWASGGALLGHLAQVARYLRRGEGNGDGPLDVRIRALVHEALAGRPAVVVAHSLGSVVAFEALHEHAGGGRLR